MHSKAFSFGEVLTFGWSTMKDNLGFFVGVGIIIFLISSLGQIFGYVIQQGPEITISFLTLLFFPVALIIQIILSIGLIKITLSFCDGRKPKITMLFDAWGCFWKYIGAGFLYVLIIMVPPATCIVLPMLSPVAIGIPNVMKLFFIMAFILVATLSIKFSLCFYFVVDKGLGPINALKASSRTTMGVKGVLFLFGIVCFLINLLGALCLGIGLFATFPTVMVAMALVYRQLSKQSPELNEFGISSPLIQTNPLVHSGLSIRHVPDTVPDFAVHPVPAIQPVAGNQPHTDLQHVLSDQTDPATQHALGNQPDPATQHLPCVRPISAKKKNNSFLLVVLLGLAVVIVAGIVYYLRPAAAKAEPSHNDVILTGILYTKDHSSAVIDGQIVHEGDTINGAKVIKIHEDKVEFESAGQTWTQQVE